MYIILYFSVFYFFFYSSWDKINRGFFIRKYKRLIEYLTSNKNLEDFYNEKKSEEIASFKNFKKQTLDSKKNMPMLLHLMALPLYKFSLLKFKVSQFVFRNSDLLKEEWQKQPRSKKIMKGGNGGKKANTNNMKKKKSNKSSEKKNLKHKRSATAMHPPPEDLTSVPEKEKEMNDDMNDIDRVLAELRSVTTEDDKVGYKTETVKMES